MCVVDRVLPCRKSWERCAGCEEKVGAEAVVGVDGVGGCEGDLLL